MYASMLFLLFYLKISDTYFSNQQYFRAFHCTSLALLSLKNTMYYGTAILEHYGTAILDPLSSNQTLYLSSTTATTPYNDNENNLYLKIIPIYFITYIVYDFKNCFKRVDLMAHHIITSIWAYLNYNVCIGYISFIILNEGITFAYFIQKFKNQLVYRLVFTIFIRFPIWFIVLYKVYNIKNHDYLTLFNLFIAMFMIILDCIWFAQNFKKLKQIKANL